MLRVEMIQERLAFASWLVLKADDASQLAVEEKHTLQSRSYRRHPRGILSRELAASGHGNESPRDMPREPCTGSFRDIFYLEQRQTFFFRCGENCTCQGMLRVSFETRNI